MFFIKVETFIWSTGTAEVIPRIIQKFGIIYEY